MAGIFILITSRQDLETKKIVESYKNLKEVEMLFDDLKNFIDIRPIRHWLAEREDRTKTFRKVTNTTSNQKRYFKMVGIRNPMNLESFVW